MLRTLIRDLRNPKWRLEYKLSLFRFWPGEFGMLMRKRLLSPLFAATGANLRVYPGVYIWNPQKISIGDNVGFGSGVYVQGAGGVRFGNNISVAPGVKIWSANHDYKQSRDRPLADFGYDFKEIIIGDNVWIGADAFLMPGVELKAGTVVAAGSVVGAKQYPEKVLLAGNPARVIGRFD